MFQACNRLCDLIVNHPDLTPQDVAAYAYRRDQFRHLCAPHSAL